MSSRIFLPFTFPLALCSSATLACCSSHSLASTPLALAQAVPSAWDAPAPGICLAPSSQFLQTRPQYPLCDIFPKTRYLMLWPASSSAYLLGLPWFSSLNSLPLMLPGCVLAEPCTTCSPHRDMSSACFIHAGSEVQAQGLPRMSLL